MNFFFIKCDLRTIDTKGPSVIVLLLLKQNFHTPKYFSFSFLPQAFLIRELFSQPSLARTLAHVFDTMFGENFEFVDE